MAAPVIQASFSAGELSPHLHGRVDLGKYKIGAAYMSNFLVDYRGGASKRPGTKHVGVAKYANYPLIFVPFQFNTEQTYMLEIGHYYMRVIQNGGYVVTGPSAIVYELATPWDSNHLNLLKWTQSADTLTFVHPLYATREIKRFNHDDWRITLFNIGATVPPPSGVYFVISGDNTGEEASAVYVNYAYAVTAIGEDGSESLISPIARVGGVLDMAVHRVTANITWNQSVGARFYNVWKATYGVSAEHPAGSRMGFIGSTTVTNFTDSNILPNFTRSPPMHNDPFAPGQITEVVMTWPGSGYSASGNSAVGKPAASITIVDSTGYGAVLVPQVRSESVVGAVVQHGGQSYTNPSLTFNGYGGTTGSSSGSGAQATVNVENGMITSITMNAYGSGYPDGTIGVITDPDGDGDGAKTLVHYYFGAIVWVDVEDGGNGLYVNPIISFVDPVVANPGQPEATGYAVVGPTTGTYPGAVAYFQQRLIFAASLNRPSTLWGSKPGAFHNFDSGIPITDGDSFEFTLASQQLNSIKYMLPMPGGLVLLTSGSVWQLSGTQQFAPVTPTQVMATPQSNVGCGDLPPIVVGFEILFVQAAGSTVRNLSYNFFANIYTGTDVTVLSSHLFHGHKMTSWGYSEEPDKIIWLTRDDGRLLSFTFLKDQEVAGWSHHSTNGKFRAVSSVREGIRDAVYVAVDRYSTQIGFYTSIERMASRLMPYGIEDAWYLDNALTLPPGYIGEFSMWSGPFTPVGMVFAIGAPYPFFSSAWIGSILRIGGGKFRIVSIISPYVITADQINSIQDLLYNEEGGQLFMPMQPPGSWSVSWETYSVGGLKHLAGQMVSVIADGVVQADKLVDPIQGTITLDAPASKVTVGLNYAADLQTLRLESQPTVQARMKKLPQLTIRVAETSSLLAGTHWSTATVVKERIPEIPPGYATPLTTGDLSIVMDPLWAEEGQIWIRSLQPLPANILAVIPEVVLGDGT